MPFRPCPSGCGHFLSADDGHDRCLQCLGLRHAEAAFVDDSCVCCGRMSMISLRSRLSFMKGLAPSATTRADLSGSSRGSPADALGDLRVTVRASPLGTPPPSHGAPSISFGAPSVDRMSIAASGDGFTFSEDEGAVGLPPSGVVTTAAPDPELTAMLARAAVSIGLEVNRPPSPEPSRLDDWFLGAGRGSQPRPAPVSFFPEVHEELTSSWMAPFTARSRTSVSSVLTTLDGGVARGYAGIPQVERVVAVHLCPRNAATWRNRPPLPSKACKLTAALAAKAYSAAGQAASALHAMAILQVHQAKALKQVHEGSTDPGLIQELRTATDFALRATKVMARSLGKAMSTIVVQERHLWLNLAEMKDVDKACFLDTPISQGGLFGDSPERPCLARGDCCPPGKGCNRAGPSSRDEAGILQLLLHRTQERWWPSANPGSASLEPSFEQAPVQDADAQAHDQMHSAPGLVCSDRPEGRLLSRFDPSATQTISTVCVRRSGMAVQGPPLRALPVSLCVHEGCRGHP